ncbi:MAG: MurR/RpiR family transcriptional regulator [Clostridia bacterium]|nr:MurR/RpiR family transcriptional regulator [Clostridia bacterium]
MENSLLHQVKSSLDFMSPVERRIATVMLKDTEQFITLSLSELAALAEVSQGSIINFANKYAGGGFSALKLSLASCRGEGTPPFSMVRETDSLGEIFRHQAADATEAFRHTAVLNDAAVLQRVSEQILKAKKVEIYGVFRSAVVATDFYYQLLQMGIPATFVSDVLTCAVSASMLTEGSLVIAISASGQTSDVIHAVKLAKENRVPVVCLTAHRDSPLAKLADEVLIAAPSGNSLSGGSTEIRLSQLLLTDAICSYLRAQTDKDGEKSYFRMKEILNSHNVKD